METLSSSKNQSWLPWFLRGILIFSFLILFARLADLQIIRGAYFKDLAENNRIRKVSIEAPRGRILDRNGEVIVGNIEIKKRVVFDPDEGYQLTTDIKDVDENELISEPFRDYKFGHIAAHITGYLGEVSEEEVGKVIPDCTEKGPRKLGSHTGRGGLEEFYNCSLLGVDGEELVEVDAQGKKVRTLGIRKPLPGEDLKTNIDINLQKKVAELMQDKKGAVIVTDSDGKILSLYSSPSYDPNLFIEKSNKVNIYFNDENLPLFNRAVGGKFAPGSVFKPLVSLAALEEEIIDENFHYNDIGYITIGEFRYRNWYHTQYGGTEGDIEVTRALARSTDTFFYKVGEMLGVDKIEQWGKKFGLDRKTGIDIPGEISGIMPGREWKMQTKKEQWFLGNTYHLSIGQGDLAVTPIELHKSILTIANEGKFCTPRLSGEPECEDFHFSQESSDLVKEGMREACSSGGTAFTFFDFPSDADEGKVACKTGTAETGVEDETHAWFVVFSPVEDPEIVATVLVERGGEGSSEAGPIAREIFNHWFGIKSNPSPTPTGSITPTPTATE